MKPKIFAILLSVVALSAFPAFGADNYAATLTQDWKTTSDLLTTTQSRWGSGWDGKIYVNDATNKILYSYSEFGRDQVGSSDAQGSAIAHDSNGNLIIGKNPFSNNTAPLAWRLLKKGETSFSDITITLPDGVSNGVMQGMGPVIGNLSTGGAAMFLIPSGNSGVAKIYLSDGVYKSSKALSEILTSATSDAQMIAVPIDDGNLVNSDAVAVRYRQNKFLRYNGIEYAEDYAPNINTTAGGTYFKLKGILFSVVPIGVNYTNGFEIVDIDNQEVVATHCADFTTYVAVANPNCLNAQVIDDKTVRIYQYVPGQVAAQYTFALSDPITAPTNASVSVKKDLDVNQPGRQDAVLTWNEVSGAASYTVERKSGDSWTAIAIGLTECTHTIADLKSETTYRVKAVDGSGDEGVPSVELTAVPEFIPHIPEWEEDIRVYEGRSRTQLLWKHTYGIEPDAYDIFRNGSLIASDILVLNYVDTEVPAGSARYLIKSVYYTDAENKVRRPESAVSAEKVAEISERNPADELYGITEVYDYPITSESPFASEGDLPAFTDQNIYRQGAYYNGHWYLAQKWNSEHANFAAATEGGIVCIDADAASAEAMASSAKKVYTLDRGANVGIAVDDKGTFFVRTAPSGQYGYAGAMTKGVFLKFNDDLTNAASSTEVDFSSLGLPHRTDYVSMKGDLLGESGGTLYLAPSYGGSADGRTAWTIDFKNGAIADHKTFNSHTADLTRGGAENYVFPLDSRDDFIHQVRSVGYFNVDPSTSTANTLYTKNSRINNSGGISLWFNRDLFIITPQASSSKNSGDFIVVTGKPDPDKLGDGTKVQNAADVLLTGEDVIPLLQVKQKEYAGVATNSNGVWFGVEPNETNKYFDLYVYVPAVRFAKYRIYPYADLIAPELSMDVAIQYSREGENPIDITSFKGTARWKKITYSGDYEFKLYDLQISVDGNAIERHYINADGKECDADGNLMTDGIQCGVDGDYFTYSIDNLDSRVYTAVLKAVFVKTNDKSWSQTSEPVFASDNTDYTPDAPKGTVRVIKETNTWTDRDDDSVTRRNYRVDIDFNAPAFDRLDPQPVSYYEIWYHKPGEAAGTYTHKLSDLNVMNGTAKDLRGQDRVAGTYDFTNSRHQVVAGQGDNAVCCYFHQPEVDASSGNLLDENEDPAKWTFIVRAKYAADAQNKNIAKDSDTEMSPVDGGTTGILEVIGDTDTSESITPAITTGPVTVTSAVAIESVTVYAANGSVVLTAAGNGETTMTLDIARLRSGVYFVSVNTGRAHKVIKR